MKMLKPRIAAADLSVVRVQPKRPDPHYQSREWRAIRERILLRDGYLCTHCRSKLANIVDHIVARRAGGSDDDDNLRSLCRACDNLLKEDHLGKRRGGT